METNLVEFEGAGPYYKDVAKSVEVTVLFNNASKNYLFFLSKEEYGPMIVDVNFESGKKKFKAALGKMLIFRSAMSVPEANTAYQNYLAETYNVKFNIVSSKLGNETEEAGLDNSMLKSRAFLTNLIKEIDENVNVI